MGAWNKSRLNYLKRKLRLNSSSVKKSSSRTAKLTQQLKALASKTDNLSSISKIHRMKGKNQLRHTVFCMCIPVYLCTMHVYIHVHMHTFTHNNWILFKKNSGLSYHILCRILGKFVPSWFFLLQHDCLDQHQHYNILAKPSTSSGLLGQVPGPGNFRLNTAVKSLEMIYYKVTLLTYKIWGILISNWPWAFRKWFMGPQLALRDMGRESSLTHPRRQVGVWHPQVHFTIFLASNSHSTTFLPPPQASCPHLDCHSSSLPESQVKSSDLLVLSKFELMCGNTTGWECSKCFYNSPEKKVFHRTYLHRY